MRNSWCGAAMAVFVGACTPWPNDLGGDRGSTGTSGSSADDDDGRAVTGADSSGSQTGSPAPTGTTEGDPTDGPAVKFDVPAGDTPMLPPGAGPPCEAVGASTVTVVSSQTPLGDVPLTDAVFGWDYCCVPRPRVLLGPQPFGPTGLETPVPDYVEATIIHINFGTTEYDGIYTGEFRADTAEGEAALEGEVEVTEVIDVPLRLADPEARLQAIVRVSGEGWDFEVQVDAPYCSAYNLPACPCE